MKAILELSRVLTVVAVALLLVLPALDSLLNIDPTPTPPDTRHPAPKPTFEWSSNAVAKYPSQFTPYFDDHFGFRSSLLRLNQLINLHVFGVTGTSTGVYGKERWLFLRDEIENDFQPLDPVVLDKIVLNLVSYQRWFEARDIEFLFVVVPNKSSIYPEYLPRGVKPDSSRSRLSQLEQSLGEIELLDLREPLIQAKDRERVYYKTDTHWSGAGQRVGHRALIETLSKQFGVYTSFELPEVRDREIEIQQNFSRVQTYPGYETERIAKYEVAGPAAQITRIWREDRLDGRTVWSTRDDKRLPRALVLHDSFFQYRRVVGELLRESFRELVAIQYVQNAPMQPRIAQASVVAENRRPDVFILEIVERNIHMIADWPALQTTE